MKKFLSMLTLVLALCLACGAALAEASVTYDYENPLYFPQNDGTLIVKFKSKDPVTGTTDRYLFEEWSVCVDAPKYADLKDLKKEDEGKKYEVVKPQTCTEDAVLVLLATNAKDKLYTTNEKDKAQLAPTDQQIAAHKGYTYFGLLKQYAATKPIDMAELKKVNEELYNSYKTKGRHTFTTQTFVEKNATCEEPGVVYPICDVCFEKGAPITVDPLGHTNSLTKPQIADLLRDEVYNVGSHKYELLWKPDCSSEGLYEGYCTRCKEENALFELDKIPTAHEYGAWLIEEEATCTDDGFQYRLCTLCLKSKEEQIIPAKGHNMVPNNVLVAATCQELGKADKYVCSQCDGVCEPVEVTENGKKVLKVTGTRDKAGIRSAMQKIGTNLQEGYFYVPRDYTNHPAENWELIDETPASCEENGSKTYRCKNCPVHFTYTADVPATDHKMVTVTQQKNASGEWKTVSAPSCKVDAVSGKPAETRELTFCANEASVLSTFPVVTYNYDNTTGYPYVKGSKTETLSPTVTTVAAPDHKFGVWVERNAPSDDTPGYWIRECSVCHAHDEFIGYEAPADPVDPVTDGLGLGEDGNFYYYVNGAVDTTFNGIVDYNGGKFLVVNGVVDGSVNGLKLVGDEFLFFAYNQLQAVDTFVIYDGAMFVIKAGKLDLSANGLLDYNGGKFVFAAGQLQSQANGLWLNPADNTWCFLANGQLQAQYSGIASYDGALFLLKDGKLATGAAGTYEQDGVKYIVDDAGNAAIAA